LSYVGVLWRGGGGGGGVIKKSKGTFSSEPGVTDIKILFLSTGNKVIPEAEAGTQLTCQLLYRLLDRSQTCSISPYQGEKYLYETSPDGVMLSAVQENVHVNVVVDVLKTIVKFSEAESSTYIFYYHSLYSILNFDWLIYLQITACK
jgi:hypothetical protein